MTRFRRALRRVGLLAAFLPAAGQVLALDILGVQNAAIDQPQIYAMFHRPDGSLVSGVDDAGDPFSAIQAFFDTGASGVLLSEQTADSLGVARYRFPTSSSPLVQFKDIGVGGAANFNVSEPLFVSIAPFALTTDPADPAAYNQQFGPLRTQIGPIGVPPSPFGGTDVLGIPTMAGKVVVMDPKPTNNALVDPFTSQMRTFVYNPGTPFNPAAVESNPGIPATNRTVALSFANFSGFTSVTPAGAEGPTLASNPFIGPNPVAKLDPNPPVDNTPGVTLTFGARQTTGSFLLDTGAAASVISIEQAGNLHVRYRPGLPADAPLLETFDPLHPELMGTPVPDQFMLTLGGIGGEQPAPGFYLDSLLVRTMQGDATNDSDPAHLRYLHVPVLVFDIAIKDPADDQVTLLTLDGLFAMNLLVASVFFDPTNPFSPFGDFNPSPFNWIVFNEPTGVLGLDVAAIPEPGTWAMLAAGLLLIATVARRRARQIA